MSEKGQTSSTGASTPTATRRNIGSAPEFDWNDSNFVAASRPVPVDHSLSASGSRSLSLIALQAFGLGISLAGCLIATALLLQRQYLIWRLPAFFAALSVFHFLEFWTTAHFNLPAARASSYLLYSNGTAYNIAHMLAVVEVVSSGLFPRYQSFAVNRFTIAVGLSLVGIGQVARSLAMVTAGTNFNHVPVKDRKADHILVTKGIYGYLRHPSYFGFFWWALGTQILIGNKICLLGYLVTLWVFFHRRIAAEEKTLVQFFGKDYEEFKKRTGTGIPFIR